jgi:hypothetical protein
MYPANLACQLAMHSPSMVGAVDGAWF